MNNISKFDLSETLAIYDYYQEFGYVVIKNAIDDAKIAQFVSAYQDAKKHPFFVYYSQSKHICTRPELDDNGFIKESMQNSSRLAFFKKFSSTMQSCIYADNVATALKTLSLEDEHISWQNMFFDKSVGTIEHQDSWYLDTEIPGKLIGIWYALEDIHPDSGAFFVVPKSHKIGLLDRANFPNHDDFVKEVQAQIKHLGAEKKPMTLNQGDIILWHPFLIHGAFNCDDKALSRKSFTSHFYPKKYRAKDTEKDKFLSIYNHQNPKATINPRILSAFRFNDYFYNILVYILYFKDRLLKIKTRLSMRREDY